MWTTTPPIHYAPYSAPSLPIRMWAARHAPNPIRGIDRPWKQTRNIRTTLLPVISRLRQCAGFPCLSVPERCLVCSAWMALHRYLLFVVLLLNSLVGHLVRNSAFAPQCMVLMFLVLWVLIFSSDLAIYQVYKRAIGEWFIVKSRHRALQWHVCMSTFRTASELAHS